MNTEIDLYLASQSPRRRELLTQIGISFAILAVDVDETAKENETAEEYVVRLAKEKAVAGWNTEKQETKPVLGADTVVVINGEILGKPENDTDAKRMLSLLSARTHQVMTAVALAIPRENSIQAELSSVINVSDVTFKTLSPVEIQQYVYSGECDDKAGSYAIRAWLRHLSHTYQAVIPGLWGYPCMKRLNF